MKFSFQAADLAAAYQANLQKAQTNQLVDRIWNQDHTVWKPDPAEISNRLGWLTIAERMTEQVPRLRSLYQQAVEDEINAVLLLGMGGSSLGPEVLSKMLGSRSSGLDFHVLDSTHPDQIKSYADQLDPRNTLYLIATKSGGTVETLSLMKYFFQQTTDRVGSQNAGKHFLGITDPGSKLVDIAGEHGFRDLFLNDPNIGGRYSVLSYFGLVPAALMDLDLKQLLDTAREMADQSQHPNLESGNPAGRLGVLLSTAAEHGKNKLTLTASSGLGPFPDWVEQLIAESTGKQGKGILPVIENQYFDPSSYSEDRIFAHLSLKDDPPVQEHFEALRKRGFPTVHLQIDYPYQLGALFFLWEFATAAAGAGLDINPFDQPNVESAKIRAREMVAAYQEQGQLPPGDFRPSSGQKLDDFISNNRQPGSYLAVQAFLPADDQTSSLLVQIQEKLTQTHQIPTTIGYGPRFLHSTGQLHKGDAGKGLMLQLISEIDQDLPIPDQVNSQASSISFGTLLQAQALGDAAALRDAGRSVLQFAVSSPPAAGVQQLLESIPIDT